MTLRRTTLKRKTEMRRTPMRRGPREQLERTKRAANRQRSTTGPSASQKGIVFTRARGCCEICGKTLHGNTDWLGEHSYHHRQPRGMGGTSRPDVHAAYQLLLLCGSGITGCHGHVEQQRTEAYAFGWLVKHGQDPAEIRVVVTRIPLPVWLTVDGRYSLTQPRSIPGDQA